MKKLKIIFRKFIKFNLFYFLSVLNYIVPKKKNTIFFCDIVDVRENQYILFKYLIDNEYYKKYKIVYSAPKKCKIESYLKDNSIIVTNFLIGVYYKITSEYIFYAYGSNRYECLIPKTQKVLNLWHGFGLKKIGYCVNKKSFYNAGKCFSYVLITSNFFEEMVRKSYNCKSNQIFICGQPKNDYLFNVDLDVFNKLGIDQSYHKTIIFLPTYRNSKRLGFTKHKYEIPLLNIENLNNINDFLYNENVLMIVKLHPTAQRNLGINFISESFSNIKFIQNSDLDKVNIPFYALLGQVDALLTDYSSVYQDYLLINKPIGFVVEDIEDYAKIRGFNFNNPLEIMPGHKIYNLEDFKDFINDLLNNKDEYVHKRKNINNLLNKYKDDNNCYRILEFMGIKI